MQKCTIILNEKGIKYKISKIIFYGNNAGFGVLCPYHSAKSGYLIKQTTGTEIYNEYAKGTDISVDEQLQYSASDRIKLSIHTDGFVQFSGENPSKIISGRDSETGLAKGMGLFSSPLSRPIMSGPTFGITLWGLNDFTAFQAGKTDESVIDFSENDYEYRETDKKNYNAYIIEGFVFPPMFWSFSFMNDLKQEIVKFRHPQFQHDRHKSLTFRVMPFMDGEIFYMVALLVSRAQLQVAEQMHSSGFSFSSPAEVKGDSVTSMHALYPAPGFNTEKTSSLDYQKK